MNSFSLCMCECRWAYLCSHFIPYFIVKLQLSCVTTPNLLRHLLLTQKQGDKKLLKVTCVMVWIMCYLLEEGLCMCISDCTCGWHHLPLKVQSIGLDSWGQKYIKWNMLSKMFLLWFNWQHDLHCYWFNTHMRNTILEAHSEPAEA